MFLYAHTYNRCLALKDKAALKFIITTEKEEEIVPVVYFKRHYHHCMVSQLNFRNLQSNLSVCSVDTKPNLLTKIMKPVT